MSLPTHRSRHHAKGPANKRQVNNDQPKLGLGPISPLYLMGSLIACLCLVWLVWWFLSHYERVTTTDYVLKTKAQYNPYYAAELLINAEHAKAHTPSVNAPSESDENLRSDDPLEAEPVATTLLDSDLKGLIDELPALDDVEEGLEGQASESGADKRPTLIISSIGSKLSSERFAALQDWIEQGGHLITYTPDLADNEDMAKVTARLQELTQEQASPEQIRSDEALNNLLSQLDAGNQFLAYLGIYAVRPAKADDNNDPEDLEAQLEALLEEVQDQQQSNSPDSNHSDTQATKQAENGASTKTTTASAQDLADNKLKDTLSSFAKSKPLSIFSLAPNAAKSSPDVIMVKSSHRNGHINADLFKALYPQKAHVVSQFDLASYSSQSSPPHSSSSQSSSLTQDSQAKEPLNSHYVQQQAPIIRRYLSEQQSALTEQLATKALSSQSPRSENTAAAIPQAKQTLELVAAMLAMSDEQLVELFKPIDDIYLEARLGKGRLSVIINDQSFTNPNPAIDLSDTAENNTETIEPKRSINAISALQAFTEPQYRTTLLSADNAVWLTALTAQSSEVWILPNTDIDPLPIMLWKQARPAILGLGLLAIIWLWSLYNSFGKRAFLPDDHSHDILRYFRQIGRFGWQQDQAIKLTRQTRDQVRALVSERLGSQAKLIKSDEQNLAADELATGNLTTSHTDTQAAELHDLLLSQIEHKKHQAQSANSQTSGSAPAQLTPHRLSDGKATSQLLIDNEDFIRASITPERLRIALAPTRQDTDNALTFTQMTQTLWVIEWLLKQ